MRVAQALILALIFCLASLTASGKTYVVQDGDSLYRIWKKSDSELAWSAWLQNVADWNGLSGKYTIYPDQKLATPDNAPAAIKEIGVETLTISEKEVIPEKSAFEQIVELYPEVKIPEEKAYLSDTFTLSKETGAEKTVTTPAAPIILVMPIVAAPAITAEPALKAEAPQEEVSAPVAMRRQYQTSWLSDNWPIVAIEVMMLLALITLFFMTPDVKGHEYKEEDEVEEREVVQSPASVKRERLWKKAHHPDAEVLPISLPPGIICPGSPYGLTRVAVNKRVINGQVSGLLFGQWVPREQVEMFIAELAINDQEFFSQSKLRLENKHMLNRWMKFHQNETVRSEIVEIPLRQTKSKGSQLRTAARA